MRKQPLYYKLGDINADCDRCGFTFKGAELRKEWTGLRVCRDCWETRHPQDFLRGKADHQAHEWTRPPGPDNEPFVNDGGTDITPDDL